METTGIKSGRPKGAKTRFRHIGSHARKLGVSVEHLRLVILGERHSPDLLARYERLTGTKIHQLMNPNDHDIRLADRLQFNRNNHAKLHPSLARLQPQWVTLEADHGLTIAAIESDSAHFLKEANAGFELKIDTALRAAGLGRLDFIRRAQLPDNREFSVYFLVSTAKLETGLNLIGDCIRELGIADKVHLGYAASPSTWQECP